MKKLLIKTCKLFSNYTITAYLPIDVVNIVDYPGIRIPNLELTDLSLEPAEPVTGRSRAPGLNTTLLKNRSRSAPKLRKLRPLKL